MGRSKKKGPYVPYHVLEKIKRFKAGKIKQPIKIWARNTRIVPDMVGMKFLIHNGKNYILITITDVMIAKTLGDFSHTRKRAFHDKKK